MTQNITQATIENFSTKDVLLATYLKINGCEPVDFLPRTRTSTEIAFENVPEDLLVKFHSDRNCIEPVLVYRRLLRDCRQAYEVMGGGL